MITFYTDRVGRKKTVLCFFGVKITGILMSWFGTSYVMFAVGRLLVGCGQVGFFVSGFVLGTCYTTLPFGIFSISCLSTASFPKQNRNRHLLTLTVESQCNIYRVNTIHKKNKTDNLCDLDRPIQYLVQ